MIAGLETTKGSTSLRRPSGNQALMWEVYENTDLVYKNQRQDFPIAAKSWAGTGRYSVRAIVVHRRPRLTIRFARHSEQLLV